MQSTFEFDVFLSYSSKDRDVVADLADRLRQKGYKVWLDTWVIRAGEDIAWAVERGLESSKVLVACMSERSMASDWVQLERNTTLFRDPANRHRRFIPLLLEDCRLPDTLKRFKYIDWRQGDDAALDELVSALGAPQGSAPPSMAKPPTTKPPTTKPRPSSTAGSPGRRRLMWLVALPLMVLSLVWFLNRPKENLVGETQPVSAEEALRDGRGPTGAEPQPIGSRAAPGSPTETSSHPLTNDRDRTPEASTEAALGSSRDAEPAGDAAEESVIRGWLEVPADYETPVGIEVNGISIQSHSRGGGIIEVAIPSKLFEQEGAYLTFFPSNGLPPLEKRLQRPEEGEELRIQLTEADRRPTAGDQLAAANRRLGEIVAGAPEPDPETPAELQNAEPEAETPEPMPSLPYPDDIYYIPSELQLAYANDSGVGGSNYLQVVPEAAYKGNFGLQVVLDGSPNGVFTAVSNTMMRSEGLLFVKLAINADGLTLGPNSDLVFMAAFDHKESYPEPIPAIGVRLSEHSGRKLIFVDAFDTEGNLVSDDGTLLGEGWQALNLEWQSGDGDGYLELRLENPETGDIRTSSLVGLKTDLFNLDELRLGGLQILGVDLRGVLYLDDLVLTRTRGDELDTPEPPRPATPEPEDLQPR